MTAGGASTGRALERATARVFCHGSGGGNPVTVFLSQFPISPSTQERLAKACEWESVMVAPAASSTPKVSEMAFYMPSGEAVSFCAHAALGGAFAATSTTPAQSDGTDNFVFQSAMMADTEQTVHISNVENEKAGTARLNMAATYEEAPVSHLPALYRLMRAHLGLGTEAMVSSGKQYPSLLNASIARPKTLVHLNSLDALMRAKQPSVAVDPKQRNSFAAACGAIDQSTGIYLYANKVDEVGAWECRQFPRASGYPEDPATGIAAAALAGSLYRQGIYLPLYKFYQGTVMQRPSLIEVLDLSIQGSAASFTLRGRVEIDSRETIQIEDER
jgi:trans-2,3-dihydro-3-hydroxyanthranilate isomerase